MARVAEPGKGEYSIACMPADGIGPEVIGAGVEVLKALAEASGSIKFHFTDYDWSSETYKKLGKYIPDGGLDDLKKHDAILFGAVGAPGKQTHPGAQSASNADTIARRTRPPLPLGSTTSNLPTLPTVCKRQANEDPERYRITAAESKDRRP